MPSAPTSLTVWLAMAMSLFAFVTAAAAAEDTEPGCSPATNAVQWATYAQRFMSGDGRIIDTGNDGVSHSEGQGFAMRLALHYGARQDFARIWQWTQQHLQIRGDALVAWRWQPDSKPHVQDQNNATDGDLFIAWSLALAGRCWDEPDYTEAARRIARAIRSKLIKDTPAGTLLLPGASGFIHGETLTLNPSYWVFPAFAELARLEPDAPEWQALIDDGHGLLEQLRFGRWELVPDWVAWSPQTGFTLSERFAPRFGYDAIRVPLYSIWHGDRSAVLRRLDHYWEAQQDWPWKPDWVDLRSDAVSSYAAPPGIRAVSALTRFAVATAAERGTAAFLSLPSLTGEQTSRLDYYSSSLSLFARIAAQRWCQAHDCRAVQD